MRKSALIVGAFILAACASGYSQFYEAAPTRTLEIAAFTGEPSVIGSAGRPETDIRAMFTQGYALIGGASFNGPDEGIAGAKQQAEKVGASHVIVDSKYARTAHGVTSMTVPTVRTTQVQGSVISHGEGGLEMGHFSGTGTTYGTETTYIPYSVDRYDQTALFFAPMTRTGYGFLLTALTQAQARAMGSAKGLAVVAVRVGSPAFQADILPGDVLRSIRGSPVYDERSYRSVTPPSGKVPVVIWRDGDELAKVVTFSASAWAWQ